MYEKLCVCERRAKILEYLTLIKQTTRVDLAARFNVSVKTIDRDIVYLSKTAPIFTKQGNQGGIYILPEYRSYKNYLTEAEEDCLYRVMKETDGIDKTIIRDIIVKFARDSTKYIEMCCT